MDTRTFRESALELSLYFERKLPGDETMRLWADEVSTIPNAHAREVIGEIKKMDYWPRNLPSTMRYLSTLIAERRGENNEYAIHPRRLYPERYAKKDCTQCGGKGLILWPMDWPVRRDETGQMITRKYAPKALCPCTDEAEYGF